MKGLMFLFLAAVVLSYGCAGTTGFAGARQQTLTINVRFEGDVTTGEAADGTPSRPSVGSILNITTGEMLYDGTRGDVAKNKAANESSIGDDDTVSLPLPQSNGIGIASGLLSSLKKKAAKDPVETVPAGLDMSLADWKLLKASYIECPECLSLTDAELKALIAATGVKPKADK